MSEDTEKDRDALVTRLKSVIGSEFEELSPDEINDALGALATEVSQARDVADTEADEEETSHGEFDVDTATDFEVPQEDTEKTSAGFLDAFSSTIAPFDVDRDGGAPLITLAPQDGEEITRLLGQVLDVQALWLEIREELGLNEELEILLEIPEYGFELAIPGRVVHRSGRQTAVDVSELAEDDLESVEEIFRRHSDREAESTRLEEESEEGETEQRLAGITSESWDGTGRSSLRLSRTFETVTNAEPHWYGPRSRWIEEVGVGGEVYRDVEPEEVLLEASESELSGLLEFAVGERQYQLYFEEGYVFEIAGRPYLAEEELGPMLRVADRVSEDKLAQASSHAIKRDVSLEAALHAGEVLPPEEIRQSVAGRLTYLLRKLCDFGEGTAQLTERAELDSPGGIPDEVRVNVPVESVIFRRRLDRFHQMSSEERASVVESHATRVPTVISGAEGRIRRSFADDAHRTMVDRLIDGTRKLSDLIAESFLPPAETFAVVFALESMDLLGFESGEEARAHVERLRHDILVKHLSVHKASYFEVLNVHWSAYDDPIDEAYEEQRAYFDPDEAPEDLDSKSRKRLQEIAERIDSAYRILKERKSRHGYRKKIMPTYKLKHGVPLLLQRGKLARRRGRDGLATDAFARVLEISPSNVEARNAYEELTGEEAE